MGAEDDRCAYQGCGAERRYHHDPTNDGHVFTPFEPPPEAAPVFNAEEDARIADMEPEAAPDEAAVIAEPSEVVEIHRFLEVMTRSKCIGEVDPSMHAPACFALQRMKTEAFAAGRKEMRRQAAKWIRDTEGDGVADDFEREVAPRRACFRWHQPGAGGQSLEHSAACRICGLPPSEHGT